MKKPLTKAKRRQADILFAEAEALQTAFWQSLGDLEKMLDIEIDSNMDLADTNLDTIIEAQGS